MTPGEFAAFIDAEIAKAEKLQVPEKGSEKSK